MPPSGTTTTTEDTTRDNATDSLIHLHNGLDDDLATLGFVPCSVGLGGVDCLDQSGVLVIPDTLNLQIGAPPALFNGRRLDDRTIDLMLALVLLDVGVPPDFGGSELVTRFVDIDGDGIPGPSLNPLANDVAFEGTFPYLAAPHQ